MPRLLLDRATNQLIPYPRNDDEPVVGLDPAYLELDLIQADQPEYNPATHRLEPTEVIDTDACTVTRGWDLMELPAIEPPPPVLIPDWATFKATAMNSGTLNAILSAAYQAAPVAAGTLAPALMRCEMGDLADFTTAWTVICAAAAVPAEVIAGFQAVATQCNLPADFITALDPQQP